MIVAVCEAMEEAGCAVVELGVCEAYQKFMVLELLMGTGPKFGEIRIGYSYLQVPSCFERRIREGERVIWIIRYRKGDGYRGIKAVALGENG